MSPTHGQKVKQARIPKPTGFGFGSSVIPTAANKMTTSNGLLPTANRMRPVQNMPADRNFGGFD